MRGLFKKKYGFASKKICLFEKKYSMASKKGTLCKKKCGCMSITKPVPKEVRLI